AAIAHLAFGAGAAIDHAVAAVAGEAAFEGRRALRGRGALDAATMVRDRRVAHAAGRALGTFAARHEPAAAVGRVAAILTVRAATGGLAGDRRRNARAQIEDHELEQLLLGVHRI